MSLKPEDEAALRELRASLLRRRPALLGPDEGEEAFTQHQILAMAIHRAVKLTQRGDEREGETWNHYFGDFFPSGRGDEADARTLWKHWRTRLLKEETPGPGVKVTHGQPHVHWVRDRDGALTINLEDMWGDFELSVDNLIASLRTDHGRREVVLWRWRQRSWQVVPVYPAGSIEAVASASAFGPDAVTGSDGRKRSPPE